MHDLSDWNVLVVDDEPDNVGVIVLVLEYYNATVRTAVSGTECMEMLQADMPTILLLDIQMPDISGFDLMQKVREDSRWQHLPIIAVTAHAMSGDQERIIASGFDGYIPKPINTMTLVDELKGFFDAKNG
ncbi:MAG: two-component system response regulator [Anaerolineaceae bacterium]|nr:two-component system response regulator [Anaerolineaceae bacterium]